jgi:hypothetical protein
LTSKPHERLASATLIHDPTNALPLSRERRFQYSMMSELAAACQAAQIKGQSRPSDTRDSDVAKAACLAEVNDEGGTAAAAC